MRIRQKQTPGLARQENSLMVPDGAVEVLKNVVLQRDNIYIKERGFSSIYDASGDTIYGIFEFDEYIVIIFNSQILRIEKDGTLAGSKTSSDEAFEIDGTLRPAPYAFSNAPFALVENDQAFFCTPEGVRVMRESSSNSSELPGLDAPVMANTADSTVIYDNWYTAQGSLGVFINSFVGGSSKADVLPFYSNDLTLTVAEKHLTSPESADVPGDTAISYKAVLRRVLPNGQTIESPPSAPVFAYNNVVSCVWSTDNSGSLTGTVLQPNQIVVLFTYRISASAGSILPRFSANDEFTGVLRNAVYELFDSGSNQVGSQPAPELEGNQTFVVDSSIIYLLSPDYEQTYFIVSLPKVPTVDFRAASPYAGESRGRVDVALDRFTDIEIEVPSSAKTGDYIDLYYSRTEVPLTENPTAIPDGDYYLAKEIEITGAGSPGWTLTTDFSDGIFQKGLPLYTNPSDGDRSRLPNIVPPGANCIESWKGHVFYGNTYRRHQVELTHIGGALTANRTFSIQFTDSGTPENFTFQYVQNEADAVTIKNRTNILVETIVNASNNFLAEVTSNPVEYPGGIRIISRVPNRAFKVFVNNSDLGNSFEPVLGTSFAATEVTSTQESKRNRVYWSKLNQPEAVPYFVDVGSEDEDILNIERTRESIIVVKRDGIFSLYGDPSTGALFVREINTTVQGISATGVTRLGNRVFAKTNQGIVAVSETSMKLVARKQLEPNLKVSDENSTQDTVMYGLEDDRQLYIATATSPSDSTKTVYSYNTLTQTWSELTKLFTWGFVVSNNFTPSKTFQNNRVITDGNDIFIERKDYLLTDWTDESTSYTVSSVSGDGLDLTLNAAVTYPVGSALVWNNGSVDKIYRVTAVNTPVVTLNVPFSGVATDSVTLYSPIESTIRTAPIDGGDSSYVKQFTKFIANLRYDAFSTANLTFRSDWFEYGLDVDWTKRDERRGWGQEQWGRFPWGQANAQNLVYVTRPSQIVQTEVPRSQQKSTYLQAEIVHNVACEGMFIQQMAFEVDTTSKRPAR